MPKPPLIVVSLEGFAASALGCYGSSWNETPTIDHLAAQGCVWDRFIAVSDHPEAILARWTRRSAPWQDILGRSGDPLVLITDVAANRMPDSCFDEILSVAPDRLSTDANPSDDVVDTHFGRLVAAAIERLSSGPSLSVLWLHSDFLTRCWDAPRDLLIDDRDPQIDDDALADRWDEANQVNQDDQANNDLEDAEALGPSLDISELDLLREVLATTQPPDLELNERSHPDLVTAWMKNYACQVRLVDLLLDVLLQADSVVGASVVITGTSGFRLGQGGRIGHHVGALRSPDIRLPLIVNRGGPLHIPHLSSSDDLTRILNQLTRHSTKGEEIICPASQWCAPIGQAPEVKTASERAAAAISNAHWFFVQDTDHSEHLFLKPDDVDDYNDVGRLREDVLETFRSRIELPEAAARATGDAQSPNDRRPNEKGPASP